MTNRAAFSKMETQNLSNLSYNEDYRFKLIHVLSKMGGERLNNMAKDVLRDITEGDKFDAILSYVWGATADQNYYNAVSSIPRTLTESQELQCYGMLLWETCKQSNNDNWLYCYATAFLFLLILVFSFPANDI